MPDTALIPRRGVLLILSSPSGAGKSTLTRNLIEQDHGIRLSVSVTTRARRGSEIDGVHYSFIARDDFLEMRERGDLLEWAEVHGNFYGTPRKPVEQALTAGEDMMYRYRLAGHEADRRKDAPMTFPASSFLPPSMAELRKPAGKRRAEDSPEVIARRLAILCPRGNRAMADL